MSDATVTQSAPAPAAKPVEGPLQLTRWRLWCSGTMCCHVVSPADETLHLATVWSRHGRVPAPQDVANARLFSAANDLLDACRAALVTLTPCNFVSQEALAEWSRTAELLPSLLRNAIAKAEGGGL